MSDVSNRRSRGAPPGSIRGMRHIIHATRESSIQMERYKTVRGQRERGIGDGVDRRGFLKCMAWAGTGLSGRPAAGSSRRGLRPGRRAGRRAGTSRSPRSATATSASARTPTRDVTATLQEAVARINALPRAARLPHPHRRPHPPRRARRSSTPSPRSSRGPRSARSSTSPASTTSSATARNTSKRFGKGTQGRGLVQLRPPRRPLRRPGQRREPGHGQGPRRPGRRAARLAQGGRGRAWPTARRSSSSPTSRSGRSTRSGAGAREDGAAGARLLKRFGSVTVLNGHIHQIAAEGRGERDLPHRPLDRLPPARPRPGRRPGPDEERPRREAPHDARPDAASTLSEPGGSSSTRPCDEVRITDILAVVVGDQPSRRRGR